MLVTMGGTVVIAGRGGRREVPAEEFFTGMLSNALESGEMAVEVTLTSASWMKREVKDGATVWTPAGAVAGLPSAKSLTLGMAKAR